MCHKQGQYVQNNGSDTCCVEGKLESGGQGENKGGLKKGAGPLHHIVLSCKAKSKWIDPHIWGEKKTLNSKCFLKGAGSVLIFWEYLYSSVNWDTQTQKAHSYNTDKTILNRRPSQAAELASLITTSVFNDLLWLKTLLRLSKWLTEPMTNKMWQLIKGALKMHRDDFNCVFVSVGWQRWWDLTVSRGH